MATKYLLPCSCGEKLIVDNRQAGESVQCACGSQLEVPTMRGLARLARLDPDQITESRRPWGPRQGLFFVGLLVAAVAFSLSAWLYFFGPAVNVEKMHKEVLEMTPEQTLLWWDYLAEWSPGMPTIDRLLNETEIVKARGWMQVGIGVGICALLVAASGLLIRPLRR